MDPSSALFDQYDADYCSRATGVAGRIDALAGLSGGTKGRGREREGEAGKQKKGGGGRGGVDPSSSSSLAHLSPSFTQSPASRRRAPSRRTWLNAMP